MVNCPAHSIVVSIKIDGKLIGTRELLVSEYSEEFINSAKLNLLLKGMVGLVERALKELSTELAYRFTASRRI